MVSGPRGVTTCSRRCGSSTSASPSRSCSSAPRPWCRTSRPAGSPPAGRSRKVRAAIALRPLARAARVDDGGEHALELRAQVLVLLRQPQLLAQVLGRLVDGEARRERRDLEEHAARLAEVDGGEVVAVADVGHVLAGGAGALLPREVVLVARGPGDVVHGARTEAPAAALGRRVVGPVHMALVAVESVL